MTFTESHAVTFTEALDVTLAGLGRGYLLNSGFDLRQATEWCCVIPLLTYCTDQPVSVPVTKSKTITETLLDVTMAELWL